MKFKTANPYRRPRLPWTSYATFAALVAIAWLFVERGW